MKTSIALGFFDGVHLAHQKIIRAAAELSPSRRPLALTFDKPPAQVLFGVRVSCLTNNAERERLITALGAECVCLAATKELLSMKGADFVREILVGRLNAAALVCGYNYSFGSDALGAADLVRIGGEAGLEVLVLPEEKVGGESVSSSRIRSLLASGDTEGAAALLGRYYSVTGTVERGKGLGRTMGFPTVNIYPERGRAPMPRGVYASWAEFGGERRKSVSNIGINPTVGDKNMRVETHILDFDGDLYGREVTVSFVRFLRPEKKFASVEELFARIEADSAEAAAVLAEMC